MHPGFVMIERLLTSLRALSQLSVAELESAAREPLRRDCADALRLELDCRQLELGASEREVLEHLLDLLEAPEPRAPELERAIRAAALAVVPVY